MMKRFLLTAAAVVVALLPVFAHAQDIPMATKLGGGGVQVGMGYTFVQTDEFQKGISGITFYGNYDIARGFGIVADMHLTTTETPQDYQQKSYEAGIRYMRTYRRIFQPYGKLEIGEGSYALDQFYYPNGIASGSYGLYSFGAGVDIVLPYHLNVRPIEYEYQDWHGYPPHGLNPSLISFGIAYRYR